MQFIGYGNSKDGSATGKSGTVNSYATVSGSAGSNVVTTSLSVAVGDAVLLHQSQGSGWGNWELVYVIGLGSGLFYAHRNLDHNYTTGAQAVRVPQYSTGTISGALTGTPYSSSAKTGGIIAVMCSGPLTLAAAINGYGNPGSATGGNGEAAGGSGLGFKGGNAEENVNGNVGYGGDNVGGAGIQITGKQDNGGGGGAKGGGTENGGDGGGGSHATPGSDGGADTGGQAGQGATEIPDTADLVTAVFGGGGGGAGAGNKDRAIGGGGAGGGFVLIIAKQIDVTSGSINLDGGGGVADQGTGYNAGGGAGGSCLIKAQIATLGSNLVTARGASSHCATGGDGRIRLDYLVSYTGSTIPTISAVQDDSLVDNGGAAALQAIM